MRAVALPSPAVAILIDFTQIPRVRTGVGVYADHLLSELPSQLAPHDRLYILAQDDETGLAALLPPDPRIQVLTIPSRIFRNRLALLAYEQIALPLLLFKLKIDVVHSLHYTFPLLSPAARAVTIHDFTFILWPHLHTRGRRLLFRPFIRCALRFAESALFVSNSTRSDAERLSARSTQLRSVTPHGVAGEAFIRPPDAVARPHLDALNLRPPYLLFLGTIEPRKNVPRLIHAFNHIAADFPDLRLVLAGKLGWQAEAFNDALSTSPFRERIQHLGYVSDEQRQTLLSRAEILVYPSLYEGFGLPILEAMALSIPVITSNVSSLPEVAGDTALLVDPSSVPELEDALRSLLTNPALAKKLGDAGQQRARNFTWTQTAATTYDAYRAAAAARQSARSPREVRST
jgi:glycosyltransferase involved in cell wall biosynthesis